MIFRIGVLLFPLLLACTPRSKTTARTMTDKEWMLDKPAQITNVANYHSYPILAEKSGCVLIDKDGTRMWVHIDSAKIPPLAKTNEYGFCENTASVTNAISVYELPDISSKVIDRIGRGMLVQIVETAGYFVKISTPKVETVGWVYKKDLSDYMDWSKRDKPKVVIHDDANAVYIGGKKILKGISRTHLDRNYVKNIADKAVVVTAKNIDDYRGTFENYAPYQQVLRDVEKGGQIRFYERGKILEKYPDGSGCIVKKEFAAFKSDKTDASYLSYDIGGEAPMSYQKWEFYNAYGEKTGEWFGDAGEGKDKRYRFTHDSNYIRINDGMTYANGAFTGHSYGYWDKHGRLVKALTDRNDTAFLCYEEIKSTKISVDIYVYSILQAEPIKRLYHEKRPKSYQFLWGSERVNNISSNTVFFGELWIDNGKEVRRRYNGEGKLIESIN